MFNKQDATCLLNMSIDFWLCLFIIKSLYSQKWTWEQRFKKWEKENCGISKKKMWNWNTTSDFWAEYSLRMERKSEKANDRSSRLELLYKKGVLKNFANSQENTCAGVSV